MEMLLLKRGEMLHSFTPPPCMAGMHLADALIIIVIITDFLV